MALLYWIHMLATVVWIGSLAAINLLFLPASTRTLNLTGQISLISALQKRLEPLTWFCIGLLIVTGLFQMSANPHYDGFLSTSTQWSLAILTKHILGVFMVVVSAIQTWEIYPAMQRALIKKSKANETQLDELNRKEKLLLRMNFTLSILVLAATAVARAS